MIMNPGIIVDLSEDNSEVEITRKNNNRRKLNELKKYIPFLEYTLELNPDYRDKNQHILNWLKMKTEFPVRISNLFENTIKTQYQQLKDSTTFPETIIKVFAAEDESPVKEADVLTSEIPSWQDREKEDEARLQKSSILRQQNSDSARATPKSVIPHELPSLVCDENEPNDVSCKRKRKNHNHKRMEPGCSNRYISEIKNHATSNTQQDLPKTPYASLFNRRYSTQQRSVTRENVNREIVTVVISDSDDEEMSSPPAIATECEKSFRTSNISPPQKTSNDAPTVVPTVSISSLSTGEVRMQNEHNMGLTEHNDKHPKLGQTARIKLDEEAQVIDQVTTTNKDMDTIQPTAPQLFSQISDENERHGVFYKKKNHKHKGMEPGLSNGYISEAKNHATSNTEEDLPKTPYASLFNRRYSTQKRSVTREHLNRDIVTVVISDSDDEEMSSPPAIATESEKSFRISNTSPPQKTSNDAPTVVPTVSISSLSTGEVRMQNEHNMGLTEHNDKHPKLGQTARIKLDEEDQVMDQVTTTNKDMDTIQPTAPQLFSQISDENERHGVFYKKKNHKHKGMEPGLSNGYISEAKNHATSNTEEDLPKTPYASLFNRRYSTQKRSVTREHLNRDIVTVVISDSDDEEMSSPPAIATESEKSFRISNTSPPQKTSNDAPTVVPTVSISSLSTGEVRMQNEHNMGLTEHNDKHPKLGQTARIKLDEEDQVMDQVTTTNKDMDTIQPTAPQLFSQISDENERHGVFYKKKNHKHKGMEPGLSNGYISEAKNHATSNTEEDLPKTPYASLFNRRYSTQKRSVTREHLNREIVTVVISDSDDEEMSNPPAIVIKSEETFTASKSPTLNITSPAQKISNDIPPTVTSGPSSPLSNGEVTMQRERISVSTFELKNSNSTTEHNEIYSQLGQTTGIQLEEDQVIDMDTIQPAVPQLLNHANASPISLNNNNDDFVSYEEDWNHNAQQKKQLHLQAVLHQEQQQQQQLHQQELLQYPPDQMHSGLPDPYNLMYSHTSQPVSRNLPIFEVTSRTTKTYAEHTRLREIEQQKKRDQEVNTLETPKNTPNQLKIIENEPQNEAPINSEELPKSIGSEGERRTPKPVENDGTNNEEEKDWQIIKSFFINSKFRRRRIESSSSSDGSVSLQTNTNNEEEEDGQIIKRFSINSKFRRRRIESSSSSDGSVSLQTNTALKENSTSSGMTPLEREKVLGIVLSAMGKNKEGDGVEALKHLSKSRSHSGRKSRDSAKSNDTSKPRRGSDNSVQVETEKHTKSKNKNISNKISLSPVVDSVESTEKKTQIQNTTTRTKKFPVKRGCRELNNLNCTFLEYKEMLEKNWFNTKRGKRRCSILRSPMAYQQLDSSEENSLSGSKSDTDKESDAISTRQKVTAAPIKRRRQTCSALPRKPPIKKIFRRLSSGMFEIQDTQQIDSDNTDEFDIEEHRKDKINQPQCKLRKLSLSNIIKTTDKNNILKRIPKYNDYSGNHSTNQKDSNETRIIISPSTSEAFTTPKSSTEPIMNADITMTLASTKICAICKIQSEDLTDHYVVRHQTESFISRLTSENIENLEENVTLAAPYRNRYKISCVFCQDELKDHFNNFYAHYSYHTGEYGFRCDACGLAKPFREEIRAHQLRTSGCRNSKIRLNYRYSPDFTVIYIYVCMICNFVQLNEANIHKHQRDHHSFIFEEPDQIKKCIIAAVHTQEVVNEFLPTNPEEDTFKEQQRPTNAILRSPEQDFVHECSLDIKDILTLENLPSENNNEIISIEQIKKGPTQENQLDVKQPNLQETGITNLDDGLIAATSPEDLLARIHAPQIRNNKITAINHTNALQRHFTYVEPVENNRDIRKIQIEIPNTLTLDSQTQLVKAHMTYRKLNSDSTYFGLYKCTLDGCWFSTNTSLSFIQHMSSHTNIKDINLNCAYCTVILNSPEKLVLHVRSRHSMSRYQCSECSYRSIIQENITIHRKIHHDNSTADKCNYECVGRVRKFEEKLIVMKQKMIENVAPLKCPDCSLELYALPSLKLHIQKTHPLSVEPRNSLFHEFACIYCKMESNSKESMKTHLATYHPDELAYVVERKLKSDVDEDAAENLNMIDIYAQQPADIHPVRCGEPKHLNSYSSNPNANADTQSSSEDNSLTKKITVTKEEQLAHERIGPLLALLTENTGGNLLSTLYRCVQCNGSFFKYELWLAHIKKRHSTTENVDCPYCSKPFALKLIEPHLATHSRHAFICMDCVTSYCSKEQILEHFSSHHKDNQALVEKEIPFGTKSFYIVTTQDVPACDWMKVLANWSDTIRKTCIDRRQQNMEFEWEQGLAPSCLEDIEIPNYISSVQFRFKCLVRSCPFVGLSEDDLDLHVNEHTVPRNYQCTHCALNLSTSSWENIKNHDMLHKDRVYICCVCKLIHHKRSAITKHIEIFHNSRDVPVISLWRGETLNYKISLEIVLPSKKTGFTNSIACFCCRLKMSNNTEFVQHLRMEHNISLFLKCELCDKILLTQLEAKTHNEEHGMQIYPLKYVFAATYLYNLTLKTMSPITIEMQLMKKRRANDDAQKPTSKRSKLDETVPHVQVKEEVVVKTECVEDVNNVKEAGGSIKCMNVNQLVVDESVSTSYTQEPSNQCHISTQPASHISTELSASYLSNQHNNVFIHTSPAVQSSYSYFLQPPQRAPEQFIINVPLPNNQGTAYITVPSPTSLPVPNGVAGPSIQISTPMPPDMTYSEVRYPQQNVATTAPQPICPGISHSEHPTKSQQNAQISLNLVKPQNAVNNHKDDHPIVPEIAPICEHCKKECTDFSHLMTHFQAVHEPKNLRFLFRIARRIECVYCPFRGSLSSLPAHQKTFHPGKTRLCRNITDSSRCGVCNEIFSCLPSSDGLTIPKCACPTHQRPLADCLDLQTLKVLQHFGRQFKAFKCALCTYSCDYQIKYLKHLLNVHHRTGILPEMRPINTLFYVCNLCGKTALHIREAIEHIRSSHLPVTAVGTLVEHMMYYNEIGVIYPHGLRVNINDLRNAVSIDNKVFTHDIQRIETQYYNTSKVHTIEQECQF